METVVSRCCGLDVHKATVVACARIEDPPGLVRRHTRTFKTLTGELLAMGDGLRSLGVKRVAMEATGVYWKPVWNLLEGALDLILVQAHHVKALPGRKTDVLDCPWIADLPAHGLPKAGFVPDGAQRHLRDLTRHRVTLVQDARRAHNRIQRVLEEANIKLGSVASDVLGKSGHDRIQAMAAGQTDPRELAEPARQRLRGKIPQLREALNGRLTAHHPFMLALLVEQWDFIERRITALEELTWPVGPGCVRVITKAPASARAGELTKATAGRDGLWVKPPGPPRGPSTPTWPLNSIAWRRDADASAPSSPLATRSGSPPGTCSRHPTTTSNSEPTSSTSFTQTQPRGVLSNASNDSATPSSFRTPHDLT